MFERNLIIRLHDRVVDAGDTVAYTAAICTRVRCDEDGLVMFERSGRPVLAAPHEPCGAVIVEARVRYERRPLQDSAIRA